MTRLKYTELEINSAGVATLWLNRPEKLNAFNAEFIAALSLQFKHISNDKQIRLLILRARGQSFCAGADIEWMKASVNLSYAENLADAKDLADMLFRLKNLKVPTLCIVHGAAYGGAVGLIACCDIAIALEDAKICLSEVNIGLIPATISPYVLQSIGYKNSLYYAMTAEVIDAHTALNIGLVQRVFDQDHAPASIEKFIEQFLRKAPQAQQASKQLMNKIYFSENSQDLKSYTEEMIALRRTSAEGQHGLQCFLEKKKANWIR